MLENHNQFVCEYEDNLSLTIGKCSQYKELLLEHLLMTSAH